MPDFTSALNLNLVRESLMLMVEDELPVIALQEYSTLSALNKKTAYQMQVKDNVNVGGRNAQRRAVTADRLRTGNSDVIAPFTLPIGDHAVTSTIQVLLTQAQQAANTAPEQLADLFRTQLQGSLREIMRDLNALVFNGDGTAASAGVQGLGVVVDGVGYAGITNALWAAQDVEAVVDSDAFLNMEQLIAEKESKYNLIVTSPAQITAYKKLFDEKRSFQVTNGTNPADLGISTVSYNGRPIISDNQCPAGMFYFLDTAYVDFYTFDTGNTQLIEGLNISIAPVPTLNQYLMEFEVGVIPQLVVKNRKAVNRLVEDTTP